MISFPKAKINIGLKVISKRNDGFHDIETIFYPIPLSDALEFIELSGKKGSDEFVITGIDIKTAPEKNLVTAALKKLRKEYSIPRLRIHLHKVIPAGAGLGGGSSDAASMLRTLVRFFRLPVSDEELKTIALDTGSDCPFFLDPKPSLAKGRGEILKPLKPLPEGYYIVLVNHGIRIITREAYLNTTPSIPLFNLEDLYYEDIKHWKKLIVNDFEDYVFRVYPVVEKLKKSLYRAGAVYSSMTGSGSSVYGIFEEKPELGRNLKEYVIFEGSL